MNGSSGNGKTRVAVLGGGAGALSAAFALTSPHNPEAGKYEVTLYQLGWRLGGKGASGRNRDIADRIEEHGLHVWMGFYENAFAVMREAYEEWKGPLNKFGSWRNAFTPQSFVPYPEYVGGQWRTWPITYPENSALPGEGGELPSLWDYTEMILDALWELVTRHHLVAIPESGKPEKPSWLGSLLSAAEGALEKELTAAGGWVLRHALDAVRALGADVTRHPPDAHARLSALLDRFLHWLWDAIGKDMENNDDLRRLWILTDFGVAALRGAIAEKMFTGGWDVVNKYEFREFLRKYGASDLTLGSVPLRALYDLFFAFEGGDINRPNIAAGVALHAFARMVFTYKGSIFWKMNAGMGDTIFSPLYYVLKERGVRFKFFHRVVEVETEDDTSIASIRVAEQVRLREGLTDYEPCIPVNGLACWPSEPIYEQLDPAQAKKLVDQSIDLESFWTPWQEEGEETVRTLRRGADFDIVILGIPPASLQSILSERIRKLEAWRNMLGQVTTVQTQAMQLWLSKDLGEMGWTMGSPITTAYAEPMDTWCDMTHLLPQENWNGAVTPKNISYFCGPMKDAPVIPPPADHSFPGKEFERVRETAVGWLETEMAHFLPAAAPVANPAGLDWALLVDGDASRSGEDRFASQYWRANCDPSHRYTLSRAGTIAARMKAGGSGFDNLFLAGDWIDCILNVGCVEATVMSGLLASRAISNYPATIIGEDTHG